MVENNYNKFSSAEFCELYNDYLEYSLKPLIISGLIEFRFVEIQYLIPDQLGNDQELWLQSLDNPYISKFINKKDQFAKHILNEGMYFPLWVYPIEGEEKYYVYAGRHRIDSLRLLMHEDKLNRNFKVPCVVTKTMINDSKEYQDMKTRYPVRYRMLIPDSIFTPPIGGDNYKCLIINKYTVQFITDRAIDLISSFESYQWFLANCVSYYPSVKPSKYINNEKEFNKWVESLSRNN